MNKNHNKFHPSNQVCPKNPLNKWQTAATTLQLVTYSGKKSVNRNYKSWDKNNKSRNLESKTVLMLLLSANTKDKMLLICLNLVDRVFLTISKEYLWRIKVQKINIQNKIVKMRWIFQNRHTIQKVLRSKSIQMR